MPDKVTITKSKLDDLANAIASKSGEEVTLTLDEMTQAVLDISPNLQNKSVTPSETVKTVTADAGYDGLGQVNVGAISSTYVGSGVKSAGGYTITPTAYDQVAVEAGTYVTGDIGVYAIPNDYVIPSGVVDITTNGQTDVTNAKIVNVVATPRLQSKTVAPSSAQQIITADSPTSTTIFNGRVFTDYDYPKDMSSLVDGEIYLFYCTCSETNATPIATSSVYVTWNSSYCEFYIANAYKVTVTNSVFRLIQTSSRFPSYLLFSLQVSQPYDGLSQVTVNAMPSGTAGTPTATKGTVSNHSISVTPSVTNTTGYITGGTETGTAITVSASELVSGTKSITENGTGIDVTNYAAVDVAVSGGSSVTVEPLSVTANGTYTAASGTAYSPVTVNVSGGSEGKKQVNFIDYDGTLLYSYTKAEIEAMSAESELPANPSHSGLVAQGWNWTLAQIKSQLTAIPDAPVWVGQMYVTDDGKTRIYLTVDDMTKSFWFGLAVNGTVSINWGDGSGASTLTGTSLTTLKTVQHTYATAGDYVIQITVQSGEFGFYSDNNSYTRLIGKKESVGGYYNTVYGGSVTAIEIGNGMTAIRNYAFSSLYNLESLTIPDSVTSIGSNAFSNCYTLESLVIPDSVTSIGSNAFSNCRVLESLTIPDSVTSIGSNAFSNCYALESLTIPDSVTSIGTAFQNCYALESLTIPNGVTSIGTYTFQNCYALKSQTIPNGVTSIGSNAFQACYALESLVIPDSVTSIETYAFQACYALESLTIPNGVTSIGTYAFQACYALESLTIPDSVTSIGSNAFASCYALKSLTIPNGVTSIGTYTFQNCYALESLTIPDSVTSIGSNAFSNCRVLESLTIPNGVTSIGTYTFQNCYALESLVIPDSVTSIESNAFASCYNMDEYHFLSATPPTLGTSAFSNIQSGTKIYVPVGSLEAYQTATNWSTYAAYMEEESV